MEKTSLYRYFSESDELLYVGVARNPFSRISGHIASKDMLEVRHIEIEWFADRSTALLAEGYAIERERPKWNVAGVRQQRELTVTQFPMSLADTPKPSKASPPPTALTRREAELIGPPKPYYRLGISSAASFPPGIDPEQCYPWGEWRVS